MSVSLLRSSSADAIDKCIAALAVAFQRHIDVATIRVYRETLSPLPLWAIEAAALQLRRTGGEFFPPVAKWYALAEQLVAERSRETLQLPPTATVAGYECDGCRDTGWCEELRGDRVVCLECSCRKTNTNYQRLTLSSRKVNSSR